MQPSYDVDAFKRAFETNFTYLNGFMRHVLRRGDSPAMHCPLTGRTWTYAQLNVEANRLAHALRAAGVGHGDVVMTMLLNSAEFVYAYLACMKIGAVSAPINFRLSGGEVALLVDANEPKVFIYDNEFAKTVADAQALVKKRPATVVCVDLENVAVAPEGAVAYRDFVAGMPGGNPELGFTQNIYDESVRFFTSGTTNLPKAVPVNVLNTVLTAHCVMMDFLLTARDITMNLTPWFHRGGLDAGGPCTVLYAGACLVIMRNFAPRLALQYVSQYGITILVGVPTLADMICRLQQTAHADIPSLRLLVVMGSPLDKEPCERLLRDLTPNIANGYGTTETFWNTYLRPWDLPAKAGSAGGPCNDDDVRVLPIVAQGHADPDHPVPMDNTTVGEVAILAVAKSTCCYFDNPAMTAAKFKDGWLYTGDLATWDEHGFVTIIGRKDDMIVSCGENIYPVQVEAILNEHPKVADSLVLGIPDPRRGSEVVALIKARDPSLTERELRTFCLEHPMLAPYKRPRQFRIVPELPRTPTGKLVHKLPAGVTFDAR